MHEVSIALGMIDELLRVANNNNAKKVLSVNLKIGKMSGIVADSLRFAFDAVKLESPVMSSAEICIEEVPIIYECGECGCSFESDEIYFPSCKTCNSHKLKLKSGEEMDIENLEVEV